MAVMIARAVSKRVICVWIDRVARTFVAANAPMDANTVAMTESATSASTSVKPAMAVLCGIERRNLDPSRQPIDPDFIAIVQAG